MLLRMTGGACLEILGPWAVALQISSRVPCRRSQYHQRKLNTNQWLKVRRESFPKTTCWLNFSERQWNLGCWLKATEDVFLWLRTNQQVQGPSTLASGLISCTSTTWKQALTYSKPTHLSRTRTRWQRTYQKRLQKACGELQERDFACLPELGQLCSGDQ